MTKKTKKYTLTDQDIQAYLCELGIKPTKEVSIYSIEYYFDKQTVSADKLSVEKLQERCERYEKALIDIIDRTPQEAIGQTWWYDVASDALAATGGDDE